MDIEDIGFGCFIVFAGVLIFALIGLAIYAAIAAIKDINKDNKIEDYKKQIKYHKKNKDIRSGILDLVGEYEGEKVCFEDMLGKLQELKGSDKE